MSERLSARSDILNSKYGSTIGCIVLLCLPFILTYAVTWLAFVTRQQSRKTGKIPPAAPFAAPVLGHTISFVWDSLNFACSATYVQSPVVSSFPAWTTLDFNL